MLLLGSTLINEDYIVSLSPDPINPGCIECRTAHGECFQVRCEEAEFVAAIAGQLGLERATPASSYTPEEHIQLANAFSRGYRFIAKDRTGKVFAYIQRPVLDGAYWNPCDGDGAVCCSLHGSFDGLSCDVAEELRGEALCV